MRWQLLAMAIATLCLGQAAARPQFYPLAGVYGNLQQSEGSGAIDGTEIIIVGGPKGYFAFYQFWEGGASAPVSVPVRYSRNRIAFDLPAASGECRHFEGIITERGFDGICTMPAINGHAPLRQRIILPRTDRSFWQ